MLRKTTLLLFFLGAFHCFTQSTFKKGYFITNNDQKTECLIQYEDLRNNPNGFNYKLHDSAQIKKGYFGLIKEFGDDAMSFKYIKRSFKIDKSPNQGSRLSNERKPKFVEDEAFLKVLVEGTVNLYQYSDDGVKKFFYQKKDAALEQLVYKKYRHSASKIGANEQYKQQLRMALQCSSITMQDLKILKYTDKSLSSIIVKYNNCMQSSSIVYKGNTSKTVYSLSLKPMYNFQSLTFQNIYLLEDVKVDSQSSFGFGVEVELFLPFNNNAWSVAMEPTYKRFKSSGENISRYQGQILVLVDYQVIEVPFSIRRYIYLNDHSKLFTNLSFIFSLDLPSQVTFRTGPSYSAQTSLDVSSRMNFALGFGYKLHDKYTLELRYNTNKDILGEYNTWSTSLSGLSFILGYTIL